MYISIFPYSEFLYLTIILKTDFLLCNHTKKKVTAIDPLAKYCDIEKARLKPKLQQHHNNSFITVCIWNELKCPNEEQMNL